ncbi:MAG: YtxH protein [Paenibacillaceae bacterium]|nr:YtxH protein [Paenibacillaceae bacterium]
MSDKMSGKDFFIGAVVGGVLGALTALLLAPKAGKELRSDIAGQYDKISEKTVEIAGVVGTKSQEIAETVSAKTQEIAKTVSAQTGEIVEKAKEAASVVATEVKAWKDSRKEAVLAIQEVAPAIAEAAEEAVEKVEETAAEVSAEVKP